MVEYRSTACELDQSAEETFAFLAVPANYEALMPANVRKFTAIDNGARLDIQGLGEVELAFTQQQSPVLLEMKPQNKVPFEFDLQWQIEELADKRSRVTAVIHAKLNFMMRMMADKILQGFLDTQVDKLKEQLNNG